MELAISSQRNMLYHKQIELTRWNNSDQEKFKKAFGATEADARTLIQAGRDRTLLMKFEQVDRL